MKKDTISTNQQHIWDEEHRNPTVLLQMDSDAPSSGVVLFHEWMKEVAGLRGLEMGCGKGRNAIWLARQGAEMTGFDFSPAAVREAEKRAAAARHGESTARFIVQDAARPWPFKDNTFDFAVDCFASTDIDSPQGRAFARDEFVRVLKPGGFLLVYTLSTDDAFHAGMITRAPAPEKNSFFHPTGKFEKVFDRAELAEFYKGLKIAEERRVAKTARFSGRDYPCNHFWIVFQK
jgi:ubiquinone/menaquinone biosynthesis C-methylase UbiE